MTRFDIIRGAIISFNELIKYWVAIGKGPEIVQYLSNYIYGSNDILNVNLEDNMVEYITGYINNYNKLNDSEVLPVDLYHAIGKSSNDSLSVYLWPRRFYSQRYLLGYKIEEVSKNVICVTFPLFVKDRDDELRAELEKFGLESCLITITIPHQ